jgi:hypothetical protein
VTTSTCSATARGSADGAWYQDERDPFGVLQDDAAAGEFRGEDVVVQVPAGARGVRPAALDHPAHLGRQVREGADLPVRVVDRHADLRAGVLEDVHLLDARQPGGPGGPDSEGKRFSNTATS